MEQLYLPVKDIHSYLRWIILALIVVVVIKYVMSWLSKNKFTSLDSRLSLFLVTALDIQFLLGLCLYFLLSPFTKSGMAFSSTAMSDPQTRFYAVEHPVTMLLAIVFAHVGRSMMKKASTDESKFKKGSLWFGLSLLFMLSRMPW